MTSLLRLHLCETVYLIVIACCLLGWHAIFIFEARLTKSSEIKQELQQDLLCNKMAKETEKL